jgi:hypothetical protein
MKKVHPSWLLAVPIVVGYLLLMAHSAHECGKRGGTLVRGVVWFECVEVHR